MEEDDFVTGGHNSEAEYEKSAAIIGAEQDNFQNY